MKIYTARLTNGIYRNEFVFAKKGRFGICAAGYANMKSAKLAQLRLREMGVETELIQPGRPIFLRFKDQPAQPFGY